MNTRVEEIAKIAGFYVPMKPYLPMEKRDIERLYLFAELIVKECLSVCNNVEADTEMPGLSDGALVCVQEIKERFGAEDGN